MKNLKHVQCFQDGIGLYTFKGSHKRARLSCVVTKENFCKQGWAKEIYHKSIKSNEMFSHSSTKESYLLLHRKLCENGDSQNQKTFFSF